MFACSSSHRPMGGNDGELKKLGMKAARRYELRAMRSNCCEESIRC